MMERTFFVNADSSGAVKHVNIPKKNIPSRVDARKEQELQWNLQQTITLGDWLYKLQEQEEIIIQKMDVSSKQISQT